MWASLKLLFLLVYCISIILYVTQVFRGDSVSGSVIVSLLFYIDLYILLLYILNHICVYIYTVVGYGISDAKKYPGQMASHNSDPTFLLR